MQQDIKHRKMMQAISERIKKVDEIDKQNAQMTKRIQQSESSINFHKNTQDYIKYSNFLKLSQKNRLNSHIRMKTASFYGSKEDFKPEVQYNMKRTKTQEDLFEQEQDDIFDSCQNNQIIPRLLSAQQNIDHTQLQQFRPNSTSLTKRPKKSMNDSISQGNKSKQENRILLQNLEESKQKIYLDRLSDAIFLEKTNENTPKDKKGNSSSVQKIFEKNREIQQTEFNLEILKAMNQVIVRGRVNIEGGSKKKYFIKTLEKNYFLKIIIRYMSESQQLFLFDAILDKEHVDVDGDSKNSKNESLESIEEYGLTKEGIKNDLLNKFISDIDIENEKLIIKSLGLQNQQRLSQRPQSSETKLNFYFKKNRNEICQEEALQNYLIGKFKKLTTTGQQDNLDNTIKKESSPNTKKLKQPLTNEVSDEVKESNAGEASKAKSYTSSSSFTSAVLKKYQQSEISNDEITKQNQEIQKSIDFFKNSKISQYFKLSEPEKNNYAQKRIIGISKFQHSAVNFRNSVQSEKLETQPSPQRRKYQSYDLNSTQPIHSQKDIREKRSPNKLLKCSSFARINTQESKQDESTKNIESNNIIDYSQLDQQDQITKIKRSSSGSQKVKLFIMLQNKQKIKAKYFDKEYDTNEKNKINNLLAKKNLSSQGQLLQNFLISKQQLNKAGSEKKPQQTNTCQAEKQQQNSNSPQKTQQQAFNNSEAIQSILLDKQKVKQV
ncbi:hypothetical protein ABPG74_001361 [Tetrahymena malaccensis]